jgi:hypothetical protein
MPRSNHPRRRQGGDTGDEVDLSRALYGRAFTEHKRGGLWNVQPVSGPAAVKVYTCPGCGLEIIPGTTHIVAWRADGLMGEAEDIAARRHWHSHCWKIT